MESSSCLLTRSLPGAYRLSEFVHGTSARSSPMVTGLNSAVRSLSGTLEKYAGLALFANAIKSIGLSILVFARSVYWGYARKTNGVQTSRASIGVIAIPETRPSSLPDADVILYHSIKPQHLQPPRARSFGLCSSLCIRLESVRHRWPGPGFEKSMSNFKALIWLAHTLSTGTYVLIYQAANWSTVSHAR